MNDDSKQATKGKIGHRPIKSKLYLPANRQAGPNVLLGHQKDKTTGIEPSERIYIHFVGKRMRTES